MHPGDTITVSEKPFDGPLAKRLRDIGVIPAMKYTILSGSKNFSYLLKSEAGLTIAVSWDIAEKLRVFHSGRRERE
jgi:hypothetical protein